MVADGKPRLRRTRLFKRWYRGIKDKTTRYRIQQRLLKAEEGDFGDCVSVGDGVFEMRFHFGPGWRIYGFRPDQDICWLLGGGDKDSQADDIRMAKRLKRILEDRHGH